MPPPAPADSAEQQRYESKQAFEQFLRQVPDDPGGLLRRKFMLQHQQQSSSQTEQTTAW